MVIAIDKVRHCLVDSRTIEFELVGDMSEEYDTGYIQQFDSHIKLVLQDMYGVDAFEEQCPIGEDYDFSIEDALDLLERGIGICIEW